MVSTAPRPTRCLVTGASGFIGARLCARFDEQGLQPYAPLVRAAAAGRGPHAVVGDLLEPQQVRQALAGCDAVVHLAHGGRGPDATRNLVQAAIAQRVRCLVHVSTMSVHGPAPGPEAAREDTARIGRYDHDYSDSKAEQEEIVQAAFDRGDLRVVILRPTVVYGPHSHFVLEVVREARSGVVTLFDQGGGVCNAIYVDDVCDAIDSALVQEAAIGQAMFIAADHAVRWKDFITAFASMVEPAPRVQDRSSAEALAYWAAHPPVQVRGLWSRVQHKLRRIVAGPPAPAPWPPLGRVMRETLAVEFANDKARRLLGWAPKVNFPDGVRRTGEWLRAEGHLSS